MATSSDLQGATLDQQNQFDSKNLGGSQPALQVPAGSDALQVSPSTLVVVGAKQANAESFPVFDIAILAVVLIVAIIGVVVWFRD